MASISAAERKRLRTEQKRRLGYSDAPPSVTLSPSPAPSPPIVQIPDGFASKEASPVKAPNKKRKSDNEVLASLVNAGVADPPVDPSWRKHLKVVTTATAEGPVKTTWDSWYPLNRVLNGVIPPRGQEKATTIGFSPAIAAIKTYGMWTSILAHIVEGSFKQSMEEAGRLEGDLQRAKAKVEDLQIDVQKYEENKSMLEGKLCKLSREAKESSTKVKSLEGDLRSAKGQLEAAKIK